MTGRDLLQQAVLDVGAPVERIPGEWMAEGPGFRLHASQRFASFDDAHDALLRWAGIHSALAPLVSSRRCLVIGADGDGDGHRVWQAVGLERSLWRLVGEALASDDLDVIVAALARAARVAHHVGTGWSRLPWALPCTLETVGCDDGRFVAVMPAPERLTPGRPDDDHRLRLLRQLRTLIERQRPDDLAHLLRVIENEAAD